MSASTPTRPTTAVLPPSLVLDLRRRLGDGAVLTDPDHLLVYEADGLPHYRRTPAAVVLPRDTAETAWVVERLHGAGVPIVPRGAGTGLSGGALAGPEAVVVGTARMRDILELDPAARKARVQSGVLNADLSVAASPHGLHYAPDPSSQSACTLGGNVAENSGGPHCLKYGVTSRYVSGLTVVGTDGQVVELGGAGRPAWPDLRGLFIGSEGCFGIATEIEVDLVPVSPSVRTLLAVFPELEQAGAAVSAIIAGGLLPAALEILDRATITAVEESIFAAGYPRDAGAVLVIEFDGPDEALDDDAGRAETICREQGAMRVRRAREAAERAQLWKGRKKAFGAMGRLAPDMVVQDATVPRSRLPAVLATIADIARRHDLHVANVFHAGDGNLHPNILFDRRDPDQVERVEAASRDIMAACVAAGGTITGEHGVGLDKRRYMTLVHSPDDLAMMARVRAVFDPRGLWNPGKVLPDPPNAGEAADAAATEARGTPRPETVRPETESELALWLRRAHEGGWRVAMQGSRHAPRADLRVDPTAFGEVTEYEPADLTITVGAGASLASLDEVTAAAGQWLPLSAPGLAAASVGGVVSRGLEGALALRFGGLRDLVLGLTLVTPEGRLLRLGGKVVKNVAGFDLLKLVVGSRGALGIITSVTFRLFPRPEVDRSWILHAESPFDLVDTAAACAALALPPAAVELTWGDRGADLMVRAMASSGRVDAFERSAGALLGGADVVEGSEADRARATLRAPLARAATARRVAGSPGALRRLLDRAGARGDRAGENGEEAGATAGKDAGEMAGAQAGADRCGWLLADRGVVWVGSASSARHPASSAVDWVEGLKRAFDPRGVLPRGPFASQGGDVSGADGSTAEGWA